MPRLDCTRCSRRTHADSAELIGVYRVTVLAILGSPRLPSCSSTRSNTAKASTIGHNPKWQSESGDHHGFCYQNSLRGFFSAKSLDATRSHTAIIAATQSLEFARLFTRTKKPYRPSSIRNRWRTTRADMPTLSSLPRRGGRCSQAAVRTEPIEIVPSTRAPRSALTRRLGDVEALEDWLISSFSLDIADRVKSHGYFGRYRLSHSVQCHPKHANLTKHRKVR